MSTLIPVSLVVGLSTSERGALVKHLQSFLTKTTSISISQVPVQSQGMCLCCQMHNETSEVLRALFMQALQRKVPAFTQVLLVCKEGIDPSSVAYTLQQDFFLKERFRYAGTVLALSRELIDGVLSAYERYVMYFSSTSLIVFEEGIFHDAQEEQRFQEKIEEIYEHIRIFQADMSVPPMLSLRELTPELWVGVLEKKSSIKKRHSLFF